MDKLISDETISTASDALEHWIGFCNDYPEDFSPDYINTLNEALEELQQ